MQKERAARALESGLPVQTPLPHLLSSRVPSSRPSAATRRARLILVLVASGLTALVLLYGVLSLTEEVHALAAGTPSASSVPDLAAAIKRPSVAPATSSK